MFQELRVKILGVVENMAYYECSKCGTKDEVFGKGYTKLIMEQFGIEVHNILIFRMHSSCP